MRALTVAGAIVAGVAAIAGATIAAGRMRWHGATDRALERLANVPPGTPRGAMSTEIDGGQFAALPAAVRRYFAFALAPGQKMVLRAELRQDGTMRAGAASPWKRFTAVQQFSTQPRGFVWDAAVELVPLLPLRIRDQYAGGTGESVASIGGLVRVSFLGGTSEVTSASLLRYLAELAWVPTALLPQAGVVWTELASDRARATLSDGTTTVSMDVRFGDGGEIVQISAMRYREVGGAAVRTPWAGRFAAYARIGGMMVPTFGEIEWSPPEGTFSAWRGRIASANYAFDPVERRSRGGDPHA